MFRRVGMFIIALAGLCALPQPSSASAQDVYYGAGYNSNGYYDPYGGNYSQGYYGRDWQRNGFREDALREHEWRKAERRERELRRWEWRERNRNFRRSYSDRYEYNNGYGRR